MRIPADYQLDVSLKDDRTFLLTIYAKEKTWGLSLRIIDKLFLQRIPERRRVHMDWTKAVCIAAATDCTLEAIENHWPKDQVKFSDDASVVVDYIRMSIRLGQKAMYNIAHYKATGEVPQHNLQFSKEHPLMKYQQVGLANINASPNYALFMEQGTGKTPIAIAAIDNAASRQNSTYRSLILCPNNVRLNWRDEFNKFSISDNKVTVIRGCKLSRTKLLIEAFAYEGEATIVIASYDAIRSTWDCFKKIHWNMIVLDESHFIKSPETKRTTHVLKLRERSDTRLILTGTPVANTPLDLWAQLEFLEIGKSGFKSWRDFRSFYGVFQQTENGWEKFVGCQNLPFLKDRLARYSYIVSKAEVLPELPDKVYDVIEVEMAKDQADAYKQLAEKLIYEIKQELATHEGQKFVVNNVLTKLLRLAQITSGFLTLPEEFNDLGETVREKTTLGFKDNPKLNALVELLQAKEPQDKTIVWACWVYDLLSIKSALDQAGIKSVLYYGGTKEDARQEAVTAFNNDPETKVFIGNPASCQTGLNLLGYGDESPDTNANHVIYYSQNWSAVSRSQSEDRAHRKGTRENVRITDLCVPSTIDEEIRARVVQKRIGAKELSDVHEILNNLLGD